ncbi:MAG: Wzz/FepE/Etk N-terminal domain-containing protein [Thermomicrobiales bacterium]
MMRLEELLPEILRRWWIVVLAALVAGSVGYILTSDETEQYTASSRIAANAEPADYWLDLYAKNRLAAYEPLINNYTFVQESLVEAGLTYDPSHAQQVLQVAHDAGRNTLTITVIDTNPVRAAEIANAVQAAFLRLNEDQNASLIARVERDPDVFASRIVLTALETANPPTEPNGSGNRTTTVAAALLGAIAGGVVIFLLLYRDDTLRSIRDLDRYVERPVLAIVPSAGPMVER